MKKGDGQQNAAKEPNTGEHQFIHCILHQYAMTVSGHWMARDREYGHNALGAPIRIFS
jgi:hypothetical protein